MPVTGVKALNFRSYERLRITLGPGLTIVSGANGAGKTNLLEAIYFGCTGRSCRTSNEREVVRFGADSAKVSLACLTDQVPHVCSVGFAPGAPKRMEFDGSSVERLLDVTARPLVSVFLPDRLGLIKGPPALRRAHLDQLTAALWPTRAARRRGYLQALAQRNALLSRIAARPERSADSTLLAWSQELARRAVEVMADRRTVLEGLAEPFRETAAALGAGPDLLLEYRPRSSATTTEGLLLELEERIPLDIARGFTSVGPHRDDLRFTRSGRDIRTYGSQGQQRLTLLALLLAERTLIAAHRGEPPLLLLDDVMSELDGRRRASLVEVLSSCEGQSLITTTDVDQIPGAEEQAVHRICVEGLPALEEPVAV
jgi:DNA replication and repair protein RecF